MNPLALESVKEIYCAMIDPTVANSESDTWREQVAVEICQVIAAPSALVAAKSIAWWHADWSQINDTPIAAATRLRNAARTYR